MNQFNTKRSVALGLCHLINPFVANVPLTEKQGNWFTQA